ncbi:MAG TPA: biosynthetic peptidoglycan transglycosylase, partial [Thermoanaerobaculia bacterium]|nr:biosynthetic peptidoglycan transglycosylase [Thermoanaerobaculia bacterium]
LAMLWALVLFFGFAWSRCFFSTCPDVGRLAAFQPGGAPVLLDRNGEAFADLAPAERLTVPLSSLPGQVAQAFLAVEDKRFYEHRGVDWTRVGGAILADLHSGDFTQGFSTLTMQLARNVFPERIPGEEQTTRRKLLEIRVAQEIEGRYSKEEILELYLNHIYFGNRARGIAAAARQYFGVQAKDLSLPQAALLAALPKAPSHYDPRRHPEKALERRNLVLSLMEEQGRIPRRMAEQAKTTPLSLSPRRARRRWSPGSPPGSWSRCGTRWRSASAPTSTPGRCASSRLSTPPISGPPRRSCAASSNGSRAGSWAPSMEPGTPREPRRRRGARNTSRERP